MKLFLNLFILSFGILLSGVVSANQLPTTVNYVDIEKYMGTWYEIAKFPTWFQKDCLATNATYALQSNGSVWVKNKCQDINDPSRIREANGTAFVSDKITNAKLKVSFVPILQRFGWFAGDYWILALADDYSYALVGSPDRKFLWFLSRTKEMDQLIFENLKDIAINQGYDISRLTISPSN
ncbi:MAG: lipocalin family protein [Oligoflexia bacterium]|nr:lipocalin family protein [Oligoflexia bacterium]